MLKAEQSDGEEASCAYNPQGQLVQANNAHRNLQWEVDAEGRVLAELQDQHRIEHQYNPAGWLKQSSWGAAGLSGGLPSGALAYQYNALGLLSEINFNGELLAQFERDTLGREVVRKLSNQVQTQSLYDPQGRLVGQVNRREKSSELSPTVSRRRYCYNQRNQLVRIDDQGHGTSLYHYDQLDRLRVVEGPTPEAFLFDPASNLLEALEGQEASDALSSKSLPEPTSPNARRPQQTPGNRLKHQGNRRFNYDARGNRTEEIIERGARQEQVTRYSYNAQNQLVEVNVAGVVTRYAYDALGRRISKSSEQGNTTFYWNGDVLLGEVGINRSRTYLFEPFSFKPLALVKNSEVFHYHTDHIGTPREITNARAEVVWSGTFKTYGALALAHVNEVDNPLRFQGQYYDEETGLHYNRHRYFDPNCGQFTTQDPIGLLCGMNAYQYAPNPMTWVDPWGLLCKEGSDRVKRNVDESRRARESSRFNEYSDREWPPNRGFESTPEPKVLMPGERIDRYGSPYGTYTSPEGTPYRARAPKPGTDLKPYSVYEVTQPIEVRSGSAKPWFGYEGGGMQYEMSQSMKDLEAAGKIKRVN